MTKITAAIGASLILASLAAAPLPALAASAHNSQLGADGPVSDNAGRTGMTARMKAMRHHRKH